MEVDLGLTDIQLCCRHTDSKRRNCYVVPKYKPKHPIINELYDILVINKNFEQVEEFMSRNTTSGILAEFLKKRKYQPLWTNIDVLPEMRSGSDICFDPLSNSIFLFGGKTSKGVLSDFWCYDITASKWILLHESVDKVGGPTARINHTMCCHPDKRTIFVLGGRVEGYYKSAGAYELDVGEPLQNDFYQYHIENKSWCLLSKNTYMLGGPQAICNHQMCLDLDTDTIYVYGGKLLFHPMMTGNLLESTREDIPYSGFYLYDIRNEKWKRSRRTHVIDGIQVDASPFDPRAGHIMVFNNKRRTLYFIGEVVSTSGRSSFYSYNVDNGQLTDLSLLMKGRINNMKYSHFTQSAIMSEDDEEIRVFVSSVEQHGFTNIRTVTSLWNFSLNNLSWTCVYKVDSLEDEPWPKTLNHYELCACYAYRMVYDEESKTHYLFGGNKNNLDKGSLLWSLQLRPANEEVLRQSKILTRKCRLKDIAGNDNPVEALKFLQTSFENLLKTRDPEGEKCRTELAMSLFYEEELSANGKDSCMIDRYVLFKHLSSFFPDRIVKTEAKPPSRG